MILQKGSRRKYICNPDKKIKDVTEGVDGLVVTSSKDTALQNFVGRTMTGQAGQGILLEGISP